MDQFSAIRAFMRIVETGSLSKAAMSLEMPKSTVSKLLADLERHLGTKLLQRSTRSVALTAEGAIYYEHVGQIMLGLQNADLSVREAARPRGGESVSTYLRRLPTLWSSPRWRNSVRFIQTFNWSLGSATGRSRLSRNRWTAC